MVMQLFKETGIYAKKKWQLPDIDKKIYISHIEGLRDAFVQYGCKTMLCLTRTLPVGMQKLIFSVSNKIFLPVSCMYLSHV